MIAQLAVLLVALFLTQDEAPDTEPRSAELQRSLSELVALPTRSERSKRAKKLAPEAELEEWLAAMRSFGTFEERPSGVQTESIRAHIGGKGVAMRLHLFVPESYDRGTPAPLFVLAHGTGGTGKNQHVPFQGVAEELGMLILAPDTTTQNAGYTFSSEEREETLEALRWMRRHFNVDENRIFLGGISRGGHLTWDVALRNPDLFAGLVPMIGGPRLSNGNGENTLRYLENLREVSIRDLQGARDDPGLVWNLRLAFERLRELGAKDAEYHESPNLGHSYDLHGVDWRAFFGEARRDPCPERVVRRVASLDEARSHWLSATRLGKDVELKFQLRVSIKEWNKLSNEEQRLRMQQAIDEHTGRVELRYVEPGVFEGEGDGREWGPNPAPARVDRRQGLGVHQVQSSQQQAQGQGVARSVADRVRRALRSRLSAGGRGQCEALTLNCPCAARPTGRGSRV